MKTSAIFTLLISITILFATCKKDDKSDCIQGNGDLKQETRNVDSFNKVNANGAYNISFSQLNSTQVDLFGDSNILPVIQTTSSNEVLTVTVQDGQCYSSQQNIEVTLTSPHFTGISLNGAGEIAAYNIVTDEILYETNGSATINSSFEVDNLVTIINGEGDANFVGTSEIAEFTIVGTGSVIASSLITDRCEIVISGAGNVRIHVNSYLEVTISGSGSVYYSGDPGTIKENITGTGQLIKEG